MDCPNTVTSAWQLLLASILAAWQQLSHWVSWGRAFSELFLLSSPDSSAPSGHQEYSQPDSDISGKYLVGEVLSLQSSEGKRDPGETEMSPTIRTHSGGVD